MAGTEDLQQEEWCGQEQEPLGQDRQSSLWCELRRIPSLWLRWSEISGKMVYKEDVETYEEFAGSSSRWLVQLEGTRNRSLGLHCN